MPRTTVLVGALYLANAVAALGRERIITTTFGANRALDSYFLALGIVTLVASVPSRAVSGPLIPALARLGRGSEQEQLRLASAVLTGITVLLGFVAVAVGLAAPWLIRVAAPGLSAQELSVVRGLLLLLTPLVIFLGLYEVWRSLLNAFFDFWTPLLAPIANALVAAGIIVAVRPLLGFSSLLVGVLLGGLVQVGIMAAVWHLRHVPIEVRWAPSDPNLRRLLAPCGWSAMLIVIGQLTVRVDSALGSFLPPGNITALSYGYRLTDLANMLLIISATTVAFPGLSRQVAERDLHRFLATCKMRAGILALVVAPVSAALVIFSQPLVGLLLGGGQFDQNAVHLTAQALSAYALGLVPLALATYLATAMYALLQMRLLVAQGVVILALKAVLALALIRPLGTVGVALSQTLTYTLMTPLLALAVWWGASRHRDTKEVAWTETPAASI